MAEKKDTIKEILVKDFIAGYLKKSDKEKENYVKKTVNIVRTYIPSVEKITLAESLINSTSRIKDEDKSTKDKIVYKSGVFQVRSSVKHILTTRMIIERYTNLRFEDVDLAMDYDLLAKNMITISDTDSNEIYDVRLLDYIISFISKEDIDELMGFIDNAYSDMIFNEYESHAFISEQVARIADMLGIVLTPLAEKLSKLDENDIEKIIKLANGAAKFIK